MSEQPEVTCQDVADYGAFVPSQLDDYPLDTYEFRAYCHVVRRAGANGDCYESHERMAAHCRMSPNKMRDALDVLVAAEVLSRRMSANRKTFSYSRLNHGRWVPATEIASLRERITAHRKDKRRPRAGLTPAGSDTPTGSVTPAGSDRGTPAGSDRGTPAGSARGTPAGSDTQRYSHEGDPSEGHPIEEKIKDPPNPPEGGTRLGIESDSGSEPEPDIQGDPLSPSAQEAEFSPQTKGADGGKRSRRRRKTKKVELLRETQFTALAGWCRTVIYDRHAPGRFGDLREARIRFAELEESDFLGYGYEAFREGITAFAKSLDKNPNQGVPDFERLIHSRQRQTDYWEGSYLAEKGLLPGEEVAEGFAPLSHSLNSYQRSDQSVDAELRQNYLPQMDPVERVQLFQKLYRTASYSELQPQEREDLLKRLQALEGAPVSTLLGREVAHV